jgi:hypothetical protein
MRRVAVGFVLLAGGCTQDLVGQGASALVGGTPTYEYPAVLLLENPDGGFCTGSLVAPDVVLTAAHCQIAPGATASVMSYDQPIASEEVVEVVFHRYHNGGDAFSDHDVSLALLAGALAEDALPFAVAPLADTVIGQTLTVVGFGVIDGDMLNGGGAKRQGDFPITAANRDYFTGGQEGRSICYGDSGGPAFLTIDGVTTIAGITRSHFRECSGMSQWTRVDAYAAEFILPFLDSWTGPCRLDGACTTDGCRTPDPDCAPCGVDGICSAGCPQVDLDCPVAGFMGDACTSADDCESRLCIDDPGGARGRYCTVGCADGHTCTDEAVCQDVDGAEVCVLPAPAETEDGGGCAAGTQHGSGLLAALALVLAALSRPACFRGRRRRRRCPGIP